MKTTGVIQMSPKCSVEQLILLLMLVVKANSHTRTINAPLLMIKLLEVKCLAIKITPWKCVLIPKLYGTVLLQRCSVLLRQLCQNLQSGTGLDHGALQREDGITKYHSQMTWKIYPLTLITSIKVEVAETTTQSKPVDGNSAVEVLVKVVQLQCLTKQEELIPKDVAGGDVESSRLQEDVILVNSTTTWEHEDMLKIVLFFTQILISVRIQSLSANLHPLHHLSGLLVSSIG